MGHCQYGAGDERRGCGDCSRNEAPLVGLEAVDYDSGIE